MAIAETVSGLSFQARDAFLTEAKFMDIVGDIFYLINMFSRWKKDGKSPNILGSSKVYFIQSPLGED